jgi:hypothetical protein
MNIKKRNWTADKSGAKYQLSFTEMHIEWEEGIT